MSTVAEPGIFTALEYDLKEAIPNQKSIAYKGIAVSVAGAGLLCICFPRKKGHPRDLEHALTCLFQYQWSSSAQHRGVQIALNEAGHLCFLWPIGAGWSDLDLEIGRAAGTCADILQGAGVEW